MQLFRGSVPDPAGGAYSAPQMHSWWGEGSLPSPQEPPAPLSAFGPQEWPSQDKFLATPMDLVCIVLASIRVNSTGSKGTYFGSSSHGQCVQQPQSNNLLTPWLSCSQKAEAATRQHNTRYKLPSRFYVSRPTCPEKNQS